MNKRVLLTGASAVAIAMTMGAATVHAEPDGNGAWATINYVPKKKDGGQDVPDQGGAGTVYGNGSYGSPTVDPGQVRPNEITDSFHSVSGIAHVQQNEGSANSINAAGAVQAAINQSTPASSGTFVGSTVYDNFSVQLDGTRTNTVLDSFDDATGVFTVQQNNGDQNEIGSAEAVQAHQNSAGPVGTFARVVSRTYANGTDQHGGTRTNDILGSFSNAHGVMTVQQNNGDHNAIGAGTSIYGATGGYGDVRQRVSVEGASEGNFGDIPFKDVHSLSSDNGEAANVRDNTINPSFDGASGVVTVQQNNGNANAISAATAVGGDIGGQHNIPGPPHNQDDVSQRVRVTGYTTNYYDGEYSPVSDVAVDAEVALSRDNSILGGSFDGFQGIATVQQNNGDHNVIGAGTAVNYNNGLDERQMQNDVSQHVSVDGEVDSASTLDVDTGNLIRTDTVKGARNNLIDNSFNGEAAGLVTVQQNNGSTNVMGVANGVQVNIDTKAASLNGNDNVRRQSARATGRVFENHTVQIGGPVIGDDPLDTIVPAHRDNHITNSFTNFSGIANVQQNNGDGNVMGIANAVAAVVNSDDKIDNVGRRRGPGSNASTSGSVQDSGAFEGRSILSGANRLNSINPSFTGFEGIATVQQNNGNNNVINAATAVVANVGPSEDSAAGRVRNGAGGNAYVDNNLAVGHFFSDRQNEIVGSFSGAMGIMTVQQNNGDNNVMGASTAVAADVDTGTSGFGPAASTASLSATVTNNTTVVFEPLLGPGRLNTINSGAFNNAAGLMTVQQNNGSNNAIQSALVAAVNHTTPPQVQP